MEKEEALRRAQLTRSGGVSLKKMVMLSMFVAIGVVISPILRVEGCCPMQHFVNIVCAVFMGPWWSLLCAILIGVIRMGLMGIPPLALTGAVFGAFLSGIFYRWAKGNLFAAAGGEVLGTGIIGSLVSYPVMAFLMGRGEVGLFFYLPSFLLGTLIGGTIALFFLFALKRAGLLEKLQRQLGGAL